MSAVCARPALEDHSLRDGRTYAQCQVCHQISPLGETSDGPWSVAHRDQAAEVNQVIGDRAVA